MLVLFPILSVLALVYSGRRDGKPLNGAGTEVPFCQLGRVTTDPPRGLTASCPKSRAVMPTHPCASGCGDSPADPWISQHNIAAELSATLTGRTNSGFWTEVSIDQQSFGRHRPVPEYLPPLSAQMGYQAGSGGMASCDVYAVCNHGWRGGRALLRSFVRVFIREWSSPSVYARKIHRQSSLMTPLQTYR